MPAPDNLTVALKMAAAGLAVFPAKVSFNEKKQTWEKQQPLVTGWQAEDVVRRTDVARVVGEISQGRARHRAWPRQADHARSRSPQRRRGRRGEFSPSRRTARPFARTPGHVHRRGGRAPLFPPAQRRALHQCRGRAARQKHQRPWRKAAGRSHPAQLRPDGKCWQPSNLAQAYRDDSIPKACPAGLPTRSGRHAAIRLQGTSGDIRIRAASRPYCATSRAMTARSGSRSALQLHEHRLRLCPIHAGCVVSDQQQVRSGRPGEGVAQFRSTSTTAR